MNLGPEVYLYDKAKFEDWPTSITINVSVHLSNLHKCNGRTGQATSAPKLSVVWAWMRIRDFSLEYWIPLFTLCTTLKNGLTQELKISPPAIFYSIPLIEFCNQLALRVFQILKAPIWQDLSKFTLSNSDAKFMKLTPNFMFLKLTMLNIWSLKK